MKNKFALACLICNISLLACPNGAIGATSWNITTFSGTNNSIVSRPTPFVTGDTLNFQNDITATGSIGSLGNFVLNVTGNNYKLDANNSNRAITVLSGADYRFDGININRFTGNTSGTINNAGILSLTSTNFSNDTSTNGG